ncbi:hypothetical protein N0V82_008004 [Gnomoniopsis sp. IMI 355080]|nr:hypothetical protein N0V82_008004 [Gnomoniopsis sp. IMI 355080]
MQFSIVLNGLVAFLAGSATAVKLDMRLTAPKASVEERQQNRVLDECTPENDCCFSTVGACRRQASVLVESWIECPNTTLCPALGVSVQDCVQFPSMTPETGS